MTVLYYNLYATIPVMGNGRREREGGLDIERTFIMYYSTIPVEFVKIQ